MRILFFFSEVESFNYFTLQLSHEFEARGHEIFILDLRNPPADNPHSYAQFELFLKQPPQLLICFDDMGIRQESFCSLWNELGVTAVCIFMDHPLRFHPVLEHHPDKFYLFCCDENHVRYVQAYFSGSVENVFFLPHAGTPPESDSFLPFCKRKYDILFSGTYYRPEQYLAELDQTFEPDTAMNQLFRCMASRLLEDSHLTTEEAVLSVLSDASMSLPDAQLKTFFRCAVPIDWMVRMYQRERVVSVLANAGLDLWLLGRGWEQHPCAHFPNVHRIDDRIPFAQTLPFMGNAKINLNVMPWFKAGTHDRIFNILLQHSLPLTDSSSWLSAHFKDGETIAFYDLEHLEALPSIAEKYLSHPQEAEALIEHGYQLVSSHFTWKNCADSILSVLNGL